MFIYFENNKFVFFFFDSGDSNNIKCHEDIIEFKRKSNANSVMIARAAMHNVSIFRKDGCLLDKREIISQFLDLSLKYENHFSTTKYAIQRMMEDVHSWANGKDFLSVNTMQEAL